ncbi:MAG TPA: PQQ-binding-like beta-propeller repeat protein [Candidatus Binatus sp.]|nr:PQQ-binding-like beta-propeller repeat protein [Candidatus Binatus sp.]
MRSSRPSRTSLPLVLAAVLAAACSSAPAPLPSSGEPSADAGPASSTPGEPGATGSPAPGTSQTASPTAPEPSAPASPPAPATTPAPTPPPIVFEAWPTFGGDPGRSGTAAGFPAPNHPSVAWSAALDGAVYGQPIVALGRLYVATEDDSVYGLDPRTGHVLWRRHVGTPVPLGTLPCGNIDPLGITSTPAFDAASDSLFVVAEVTGPKHVLFALNPASGAIRWSRSVDWPGQDPSTLQQRAALAVANGRAYIGFGGLAGDCGQYNGVVVGVPTGGGGASIAYVVPTAREGAVWATGGPAIDAAGHLYVSVGNGSATSVADGFDGSDSIVELSAGLSQLGPLFAPSTWAADNLHDLDLGSMSPTLLSGGWVFADGKSGTGYVLRQGALGGIGGQVSSRAVCVAFGAAAHVGATAYVPCTDGIRSVTVDASGSIHIGWHTSSGATGPPAVGGGAVWSVDIGTGTLIALSQSSGVERAAIHLGAVPHFDAPSLSGDLVFVGTLKGVVAVRAAP